MHEIGSHCILHIFSGLNTHNLISVAKRLGTALVNKTFSLTSFNIRKLNYYNHFSIILETCLFIVWLPKGHLILSPEMACELVRAIYFNIQMPLGEIP